MIKKHDNVHYINKNYVLQPIYNDENECINDTLSRVIHIRLMEVSGIEIILRIS